MMAAGAAVAGGMMASGAMAAVPTNSDAVSVGEFGVSTSWATSRGGKIGFRMIRFAAPWRGNVSTVLFHHSLGESMETWSDWLPALIANYNVLMFDMRGHGMSKAAAADPGSLDRLGDDVLAVADAAGASHFHFVGHTIGGVIGERMAIARPERMLSLTICGSPDSGGDLDQVAFAKLPAQIASQGVLNWAKSAMDVHFGPGEVPQSVVDWYANNMAGMDVEFFLACLRMVKGVDLAPDLPKITTPTLILSPDRSPAVPVALAAEILNRIKTARMQVIPNTRQALLVSQGTKCGEALAAFLAEIGG